MAVTMPAGNAFDFGPLADAARERARRAAALQERLRSVEGVGRSDDGLLAMRCTAFEGIVEISIDPRAMRLGSQALGEQLVQVAAAAKRDLEAQTRQVAAEAVGGASDPAAMPDPQAMRARMEAATAALSDVSGDANALIKNLRQRLGR
jgi:DNA-binding protein YbaB